MDCSGNTGQKTAADIYAVLNLGPLYGLALAVYFTSLGQQLRQYFKKEKKGDGLPALPISSIFDPERYIYMVDYHPPTVWVLHAIIGAIRALEDLSVSKRDKYINLVEKVIGLCLKEGNTEVVKKYASDPIIRIDKYKTDSVMIQGPLQIKAGSWVYMGPPKGQFDPDNSYPISIEEMQEHAKLVGHYIASAKLATLNHHSIQDLETWDEADDAQAEQIMSLIATVPNFEFPLSFMGDDAQLFAGAIGALAKFPDTDHYRIVNQNLCNVLKLSFASDEIWGNPQWHPLAGENML